MTGLATDSRARALEELRGGDRFLLVTHEHPDGDAIGSLVAMQGILRALGKDTLMFIAPDELPLPQEYRWLDLDGMVGEVPADIDDRVVVFLDCGNIDRTPVQQLREHDGSHIVNLDHHHDNTRFGDVDHVVADASCTAEIVWDLMHELGVRPTVAIAEALYVGLVTDTGRFMYENTGPRAHLMAADLIEAGVETAVVYRRLYEGMPFAKIDLLGRALSHVRRFDEGRLTLTTLGREDFDGAGADDSLAEGIIDHLRSVAGTLVAAFVREREEAGLRKVSLRSTDGSVDVSVIARALGGGGHRRAAGATTSASVEEIAELVRSEIAVQLAS